MKWPWNRLARAADKPEGDTGGKDARKRAEEALKDVRHRKQQTEPLRRFFREQKLANHFRQDVDRIWEGSRR